MHQLIVWRGLPLGETRYKQGYTMAQKTWAARHSAYPQTNLGLSNEGIRGPVITTWNQWQVWKMKTKAGCHRHIPQTLEDAKQCQPLFGQGSGTDSGCTWRDSLGLQLRIPAPSPKGPCSSLWRSAHLSVRMPQGPQRVNLGMAASWSLQFSQYRYYHFRKLGQNPSLPSTSNSVSEQGSPLCLWGPWVWGNVHILYAVQQEHVKSERLL